MVWLIFINHYYQYLYTKLNCSLYFNSYMEFSIEFIESIDVIQEIEKL
jgi:hypothetical protein